MNTRQALDRILNLVDYTNNQCSVTAMIGAALAEEELLAANLVDKPDNVFTPYLKTLLDQIDYTAKACSPFEMVGACLPAEVIRNCRAVLRDNP